MEAPYTYSGGKLKFCHTLPYKVPVESSIILRFIPSDDVSNATETEVDRVLVS